METEVLKEQHYVEELVEIIRSGLPKEELIDRLSDYHDNDIADALTKLTPDERRELYPLIGVERVAGECPEHPRKVLMGSSAVSAC